MEVTQPPEVWVTNSPAELGTTMVKVGLRTNDENPLDNWGYSGYSFILPNESQKLCCGVCGKLNACPVFFPEGNGSHWEEVSLSPLAAERSVFQWAEWIRFFGVLVPSGPSHWEARFLASPRWFQLDPRVAFRHFESRGGHLWCAQPRAGRHCNGHPKGANARIVWRCSLRPGK